VLNPNIGESPPPFLKGLPMSLNSWFTSLKNSSRRRNRKSSGNSARLKNQRRMFVEPLEDRRLLAANLLNDGGFEVGLTNGPGTFKRLAAYGEWTSSSGKCGRGSTAILGMPYFGLPALEGVEAMHLGDCFGPGAVSQSFDTTIGTQYDVSLSVIGWSGGGGRVRTTLSNPIATDLVADFVAPGGNNWGSSVYTFTASDIVTTIKVQNISGASTVDDVKVVAANSVPTIAADIAAVSADEGSTATNTGTFSDAQGNSTVTIAASIGTVTKNDGTWSWSANAADGPAGPFTVTITATDDKGAAANATFTYAIDNVPPTISLSGNATVNEGSVYTLNLGVVTDPGQDTITSYTINWGDGASDSLTGNPENTTATHSYADGPDNQTHNVTVTDEDGTFLAGSLSVQVLNVTPTIALSDDTDADEGSSHTLNLGTITDPGADTVTAYSINWGDGSAVENYTGNPANTTKTHTYADGTNFYLISVSLTDEDGTYSDAGMIWVRVNNVAPTAPADNNAAADEVTENAAAGTLVGITAASTDVGVLDTITYSLTDDAGGRFTIDANTGVVSVATGAVLDYETAISHTITVQASDGEDASTQNFTINLLNVTATISGTVFVDVNGNGLFDGGTETGIDGVTVKLLDSAFAELAADVTELGGVYAFTVDDEFGTFIIRETQPTGVTDGAAILGDAAVDSVLSSNEMQLTLAGVNASDYDFTEVGQAVQAGDTATIGFWQNKNGQALIKQGGAPLVTWLNANFGNIFGNTFSDMSGTNDAAEVASFYKNEFFMKKLKGTSKVDAQFMATALATFFTSSNLSGGSVAAGYGFNVTDTGIGTKVVNVGSSGAAFGVANNTDMTIMALLLATNNLTGDSGDGSYRNVYDTNGDGVLDDAEKALRSLANTIYTAINEDGDI